MSRVTKKPEVRQQEILDAARQLFQTQGYEHTSVEAIIKAVGVAKGTFYYYFKTKKDILSALVKALSTEMAEVFQKIAETEEASAIQKLEWMIRGPEKEEKKDDTVMSLVHIPENRELQEQLNIGCIEILAPWITQVLLQGYQEGRFKKPATLEKVQLILAASQFMLDSGLFVWPLEKRKALLKSLQELLEFTVGAAPGDFDFIQNKGE